MTSADEPSGDRPQQPETPDWGRLFEAHHQAMQQVAAQALQSSGRHDLAEDAMMQAFLSLMLHPPSEVGNWEALLVATAKHRAIDTARSFDLTHRDARGLRDDMQPDESVPDTIDDLDTALTASQAMAEIARLPDLQQRVVRHTVLEQRSIRVVAADLGLSPARVSQLKTAALATLRERLSATSDDG